MILRAVTNHWNPNFQETVDIPVIPVGNSPPFQGTNVLGFLVRRSVRWTPVIRNNDTNSEEEEERRNLRPKNLWPVFCVVFFWDPKNLERKYVQVDLGFIMLFPFERNLLVISSKILQTPAR